MGFNIRLNGIYDIWWLPSWGGPARLRPPSPPPSTIEPEFSVRGTVQVPEHWIPSIFVYVGWLWINLHKAPTALPWSLPKAGLFRPLQPWLCGLHAYWRITIFKTDHRIGPWLLELRWISATGNNIPGEQPLEKDGINVTQTSLREDPTSSWWIAILKKKIKLVNMAEIPYYPLS